MPRHVDYYFSIVSPWAYIGHQPFQQLVKQHKLDVNYKPVTLGELFAETGGLPLGKRHPARQRYRMIELQRWREKRGLDFHLQPKHWPFHAAVGDGMIIAARDKKLDPEPFLASLYKAVWEEQKDLTDLATLTALADSRGLPGAELLERASTPDIAATYEQYRQDAMEAGVFGSPAYVLDGEVFWGQDRIELLADALKSGRKAFSADV